MREDSDVKLPGHAREHDELYYNFGLPRTLGGCQSIYRDSVKKRKRVTGPDHTDTLASHNNLGTSLSYRGAWSEAELLFVDHVQRENQVLGLDHWDTFVAMTNLEKIWKCQERTSKAIEMEECLKY